MNSFYVFVCKIYLTFQFFEKNIFRWSQAGPENIGKISISIF